MIIFTRDELAEMSRKQLGNLRRYYKLPTMKKPELIEKLYFLINPKEMDVWDGSDNGPIYDEHGNEIQLSVQARRAYKRNE